MITLYSDNKNTTKQNVNLNSLSCETTVKVVLTLLNGPHTPQHGRCKHQEAAGLIELDLSHDAEGGTQADGHHGCVFDYVMLLAQDQCGDGQGKKWSGGIDHLCK